jgi:hypothetical protein
MKTIKAITIVEGDILRGVRYAVPIAMMLWVIICGVVALIARAVHP